VNVAHRSIQANYAPYTGGAAFLAGATRRTADLWNRPQPASTFERAQGVYEIDEETPRARSNTPAGRRPIRSQMRAVASARQDSPWCDAPVRRPAPHLRDFRPVPRRPLTPMLKT